MVRLQPRFEKDGSNNGDVRANGRHQSLEDFKGTGGGVGDLQAVSRQERDSTSSTG